MPLDRSPRGTTKCVRDTSRWTKASKVSYTPATLSKVHVTAQNVKGNRGLTMTLSSHDNQSMLPAKPVKIASSTTNAVEKSALPPSPPSYREELSTFDTNCDFSSLATPVGSPVSSEDDSSSDSDAESISSLSSHCESPSTESLLCHIFPEVSSLSMPSDIKVTPLDSEIANHWTGFVLSSTVTDSKTLYVHANEMRHGTDLRANVIDLLEMADEQLSCKGVIIVLEKNEDLAHTLHSLIYVGGTVVTESALKLNPDLVFVGLDL